jgi:TolB-like protein/DNA-binding SARP family transcriptional activator/Flp pilus assembly protein TadD
MIELRLLGGLGLTDTEGRPLGSVLSQPKRVALLAYLALARPRGFHRRDTLLGMFWPESDEERGRAALSQAVYYLRRSLGTEALESRGNDELRLDADRVWTDATAFEAAMMAGGPRGALELYRGELLPGFYLRDVPVWERWLDVERDRLRALAAQAAWGAVDQELAAGDLDAAVPFGRKALELSPYDETGLRRLVSLLDRAGQRAAAIAAYEEVAERMRRDLGIEPSAESAELLAAVRSEPDAPSPDPPRVLDRPPVPARTEALERRRGARIAVATATGPAGVAALALVVGSLAHGVRGDDGGSSRTPTIPAVTSALERVAVLPFENLSPDPENRYLAAGTSEELRGRLSRLGSVFVIAGSSAARYGGSAVGAAEIGAELGVGTLVEGAVRASGGRLRVSVQIVDVESQATLWSREFDGSLEDILSLQGEIAEAVARALGLEMRADERRHLATSGTEDSVAYRLYLAGRERLGTSVPDSVMRARAFFEQAIAADSGFARAWAGLGDVYDELAGMNVVASADAYPLARELVEEALSHDPDLGSAHGSLGLILDAHFWDTKGAERHFRRAIELDPSDARSRRAYAGLLRKLGRYEAAHAQAVTALELAPRDFFSAVELVVIPYFERRFETAAREARRLVAADPTYVYGNVFLALVLAQQGRYNEALEALDALGPLASLTDPLTIRGYILGRAGRIEEAREIRFRLRERAAAGRELAFGRAVVQIGLGEDQRALELLEEAADARDWRMRLIGQEPIFDPLRSEPRFETLLDRAGL